MYSNLKLRTLLTLSILTGNLLLAQAQDHAVRGKITDAKTGELLGNVTIKVKGSNQSLQSSTDGTFSISTNPNTILVITSTGYRPYEVKVGQLNQLDIKLESKVEQMDEVVVVGYGTQNRRSVTGSIAKVDKTVLQNTPRSNVATALQGTVPGLQVVNKSGTPGAAPMLKLRGGASIKSSSPPLVVIDGVIREMNDVSSDNIESIELLKDASVTAIYGARANNGVVLITTKTGKSGVSNISYKFTAGFNQRREGYRYMNAGDYIYYTRLGYLNAGKTIETANGSRGLGLLTDNANLSSFDIRRYTSDLEPLLAKGWQLVDDPYGGQIIYKDHSGEVEDILFRNTYTKDHYVNVSGGNDRGKYFAAFDAYNENGIIVGSNYKRYTADLNGSYKLKPNLEVVTSVNLSTASQYGVGGSEVSALYRNLAIWPTFNPWVDEAKTRPNPGNGINDGNPLYWLSRMERNNETNRIVVNGSLKWDIIPGLYFKVSGNAYMKEVLNEFFQKSTQTYANVFSNPETIGSTSRDAYRNIGRDFQTQFNGILNYTKTFGEKHNLNAMLGAEYFNTKTDYMQVYGKNAPTDDIPTVNASTVFVAGNNTSSKSEYRIISSMGRLAYDYDGKYLLNAVYRLDGVSSLADGHRWGFFPGLSAGWNVHQEVFFKNTKLAEYISTLKPRLSYGENGNINGLGRYEVQGTYSLQTNYNGTAGYLNTQPVNGNLVWETSKTTGIGLDLGLWHDRVTLLFDYYNRKTKNLLTDLTLPSYIGFSSINTNLGTLQNKGLEFGLQTRVLSNPDGINLNIGANAAFVKNKILELPNNGNENNRQGGLQVFDPVSGQIKWVGGYQEGQSLGDIYAFKQVSIFKDDAEVMAVAGNRTDNIAGITGPNLPVGKNGRITPGDVNWLDVDGNDMIDSRDQVYIGNINPKWTGGFTTNLSYKNLSLFSNWEFALGHKIYNDLVARTLGNYQGTFNYIDLQKQAWSPTNTITDIPKVYFADQVGGSKQNYTRGNNANAVLNSNNSRFYEKGDYLALRELTLSYDMPKSLLEKSRVFSHARIYFTGSNLFYITKFSGPSPEPPVDVNNLVTGIYLGTYPTPRSYVLGVQLSF
ncbi:SusC/RagA family TonB-linked outer membrane protein [Sphingobacterium sp. UBA5670]|uniref:SusC/RagA family TonB-linked outer membrane protein n=1 Tax=Sphingobacterium sp. UBA5670 TaxID=1947502 RepID=UPI0025D14479|nr:SusC/RagA family TonB-linked outer membrane protein [Sphingobacterium sp. UBA5670]